MTSCILVDHPAPAVRRITLNRPAASNAFTQQMYDEFENVLQQTSTDLEIRAIILTGAGRNFCTGADLRQASEHPEAATGRTGFYAQKLLMARISRLPLLMRALPQPVIAAVNGAVAGIGYPIALSADMAIAGTSAKFVNAIHNAGTGHELGLSYLLSRQIGTQRAAEILLTARPVLSDEAERIGLVLRTVADDQLMHEA